MELFVDHPMAAAVAGLAVPDWVHGAWRRDRWETPAGEDSETDVLWVQTPLLYAGVAVSPGGEERGFAGHLHVGSRICAWQRLLDLVPPTGPGDAGAMYRNGDRMIEIGLHANYLEEWELLEGADRHLAATRGEVGLRDSDIAWPVEGMLEILVACGPHVLHAQRAGRSAAIRQGRFDASTGRLEPVRRAGGSASPAHGAPWTLWSCTMSPVARDALLGALPSL